MLVLKQSKPYSYKGGGRRRGGGGGGVGGSIRVISQYILDSQFL